jgi:V-type H+-transporting ATPase subunit a
VVKIIIMDVIFFLQVKRYGEMSRKLRFFHEQVAKAGKLAYRPIVENVTDLDELDHKLGDLESELLEINANNDKLQSSQSELTEFKLVLQNVSSTLPFVL